MKTIGLLGGMSWESSAAYYKIINEYTNELLGSLNNAKSILVTVNFEEIEKLQHKGKWKEAADILIKAAQSLQNGGADFIVICTNTMHKLLPQITLHVEIPFLHIAQATANKIKKDRVKKVLLLGTKFTMQENFYKQILIDNGIEVTIPNDKDMDTVHKVIYNELCLGEIKDESKKAFIEIIKKEKEVNGVILGCTEIGMLVSQNDMDINVYDTTVIHAKEAVRMAL
ncbi:MAG: aspartate/glutamate racemase family protein [Sulfurospirillum sp.]